MTTTLCIENVGCMRDSQDLDRNHCWHDEDENRMI